MMPRLSRRFVARETLTLLPGSRPHEDLDVPGRFRTRNSRWSRGGRSGSNPFPTLSSCAGLKIQ